MKIKIMVELDVDLHAFNPSSLVHFSRLSAYFCYSFFSLFDSARHTNKLAQFLLVRNCYFYVTINFAPSCSRIPQFFPYIDSLTQQV